jgi:hypothetical protein
MPPSRVYLSCSIDGIGMLPPTRRRRQLRIMKASLAPIPASAVLMEYK